MLSEELRNLALWISTRRRYRALRDLPCDAYGERTGDRATGGTG